MNTNIESVLRIFLSALNLPFKKMVIAEWDKIHMSLPFSLLSIKYLSGILGNEMSFGFFWHSITMTQETTIKFSRCTANYDHIHTCTVGLFNPHLHTDLWTHKRTPLCLWLEWNEKSIRYKNSTKKRNIVNTVVKQDERKKFHVG